MNLFEGDISFNRSKKKRNKLVHLFCSQSDEQLQYLHRFSTSFLTVASKRETNALHGVVIQLINFFFISNLFKHFKSISKKKDGEKFNSNLVLDKRTSPNSNKKMCSLTLPTVTYLFPFSCDIELICGDVLLKKRKYQSMTNPINSWKRLTFSLCLVVLLNPFSDIFRHRIFHWFK